MVSKGAHPKMALFQVIAGRGHPAHRWPGSGKVVCCRQLGVGWVR
jgi:hypothetical protein